MTVDVSCAGILVVDFIAADLPKISDPGELTFTPVEMHIGGHAANVSIDLVKLGLKGGVSSIGAVGQDLLGDFVEQTLKSYGVAAHLVRTREARTSIDLILVVRGEDRRFHFDIGANLHLDPARVEAIIRDEAPLIFYGGAVGLLGEFDEVLSEVLRLAKGMGSLTLVDPIKPYRKGWEFLWRATPYIDVFHCNNLEAAEMTGESNVENAVQALMRRGVKMPIISTGGGGIIAGYGDAMYYMPTFKVKAVDPTGAGDAFCSGIIRMLIGLKGEGLRRGLELDEEELIKVLAYGQAAGAVCVTAVGTTTAVEEGRVDELMKEQGDSVISKVRKVKALPSS
ncbi:MAG: carbohydrate kinase family protein [Candidatus Bathyarchaeia archaeon]